MKKRKTLLESLVIEPSLEKLLPACTSQEDEALKEAIKKDGVMYPLVADEQGKLIDGIRTHRICKELGIKEVWVVTLYGLTKEERRHKRLSLNANRRNLSLKQKRELIRQELQRKPAMSAGKLGRIIGVSHNTVQRIKEDMIRNGQIDRCPVEASDGRVFRNSGILTTLHGIRHVQKTLAEKDNLPRIQKVVTRTKFERILTVGRRDRSAAAGAKLLPEKHYLLHPCRFQDLLKKEPRLKGAVPLIVTDPPWDAGFLPEYDELGRVAGEMLKPGGILVCYSGVMHLPQTFDALGKHLDYTWMVPLIYNKASTGSRPGQKKGNLWIYDMWRPVLIFSKGKPRRTTALQDWRKGSGAEKEFHDSQQNLEDVKFFVEVFSNRGDLVVDLCGGGFTTAVACKELGRKFVGCDKSQECVNIGKQRLAQVTVPLHIRN